MADAGGQQHHVTSADFNGMSVGPAEHQSRMANGNPEHFMALGVIVVIIVNPVAPLRWPAIGVESLLEQRGRVVAFDGNRLAVD